MTLDPSDRGPCVLISSPSFCAEATSDSSADGQVSTSSVSSAAGGSSQAGAEATNGLVAPRQVRT